MKKKKEPAKIDPTVRSRVVVQGQIDAAAEIIAEGRSKYFGLTYEEGVRCALEWVIGDSDDLPMEE